MRECYREAARQIDADNFQGYLTPDAIEAIAQVIESELEDDFDELDSQILAQAEEILELQSKLDEATADEEED